MYILCLTRSVHNTIPNAEQANGDKYSSIRILQTYHVLAYPCAPLAYSLMDLGQGNGGYTLSVMHVHLAQVALFDPSLLT